MNKEEKLVEAFCVFSVTTKVAGRELTSAVNDMLGFDLSTRFLRRLSEALDVPVELLPQSVNSVNWLREQVTDGPNMYRVCTQKWEVDVDDIRADPSKFTDIVDESVEEAVKMAVDWRNLHCVCGTRPHIVERVTAVDPFQIWCRSEAFMVEFFLYAGLYFHLVGR